MAGKTIAVLAVAVLAAGCAGVGVPTGGVSTTGDVTVLEVENFKLNKANVVALDGASGGKAVVLVDEASEAGITIPMLKKGDYELIVHGLAPSYEEDAFLITVGDLAEERLFISDINRVLPTAPLPFTQRKDGPCKVVLMFGEDNVKLDRIEIRPVK